MNRKKKELLMRAIVLTLAAAVMACSSKKDSGESERVPVEVASAKRQTIARSLTYDGDVRAEFEIQVFSRVPDRIEKFLVDVGDHVRQGAMIARVRATAIEQAVLQAEAGLVAARSQEANVRLEFERSQRLFQENALSQQQLDAIKTQYEAVTAQREQAEAMVKTAKSQLNDALITAPISGIVATRNYEEGDMASPARSLVTIVQMNRVKVAFDVAESDIGSLKTRQPAEIRVKSYPDRVFKGTVSEISPVLDPATRMARVEVVLDNRDHMLKPGMFARVEVRIGSIDSVIVVPRHATMESTSLAQEGGKVDAMKNFYIYVVTGDRVEQRKLAVAYANHEFVAVSSGLSEGERYVTVGQAALRDSARIVITGQ
jgi:HlyD family secretion protein